MSQLSKGSASAKKLVTFCADRLLSEPPKRVVISGPSGFLGSRVVWSALDVHALRQVTA
jgi:hypothetical protein